MEVEAGIIDFALDMGFREEAVRRSVCSAQASQSAGTFDAKCQKSLGVTLGKSNRTAEVNCSHKNGFERKESELDGRKNDILCTGQRKHEP